MIIDFLIAIVAPLLIPIFNNFVYAVKKPLLNLLPGRKKVLEYEEIPVFLKELPTAFIANAIWGMAYSAREVSNTAFTWVIVYAFIAMMCYIPILYSHTKPNISKYKVWIIIISIALSLLTIVRILLTYGKI